MERLLAEVRTSQAKICASDETIEILRGKNADHSKRDEKRSRGNEVHV
jgi:hypothetical protein